MEEKVATWLKKAEIYSWINPLIQIAKQQSKWLQHGKENSCSSKMGRPHHVEPSSILRCSISLTMGEVAPIRGSSATVRAQKSYGCKRVIFFSAPCWVLETARESVTPLTTRLLMDDLKSPVRWHARAWSASSDDSCMHRWVCERAHRLLPEYGWS
jgi:hypothetical protein